MKGTPGRTYPFYPLLPAAPATGRSQLLVSHEQEARALRVAHPTVLCVQTSSWGRERWGGVSCPQGSSSVF